MGRKVEGIQDLLKAPAPWRAVLVAVPVTDRRGYVLKLDCGHAVWRRRRRTTRARCEKCKAKGEMK